MEKLEIIELIAHLNFDEKSFTILVDPAGRLSKEKRQHYQQLFEKTEQNLVSFYKGLDGEASDIHYIRESINNYIDHKVRECLLTMRSGADDRPPAENRKIKPIDDLDGSDSWGYNNDVKGK